MTKRAGLRVSVPTSSDRLRGAMWRRSQRALLLRVRRGNSLRELSATTGPSRRARKSRLGVPANGRSPATSLGLSVARPGQEQVFVTVRFRRSRFRVSMHDQWRRGVRATACATCMPMA